MSFGVLAPIVLAGLAGPLLASGRRAFVPVVVGEIAAGVIIGRSGFGRLDPAEPTTAFLAEVDFGHLLALWIGPSCLPLVRERDERPGDPLFSSPVAHDCSPRRPHSTPTSRRNEPSRCAFHNWLREGSRESRRGDDLRLLAHTSTTTPAAAP